MVRSNAVGCAKGEGGRGGKKELRKGEERQTEVSIVQEGGRERPKFVRKEK